MILITASLGKPIVSGVVDAKSYKATTWSITPDGNCGCADAASLLAVVAFSGFGSCLGSDADVFVASDDS